MKSEFDEPMDFEKFEKYRIDPNKRCPAPPFDPQTRNRRAKTIGKWKVLLNGDMFYDEGRYEITGDCLMEDDWIVHLFEKGWIDWNEFIPAYFQALKNIKCQHIKMKIYY